jgi:alkylhydroperoxidase family enzyme
MVDDRVPFDELDHHYRPLLTFVETLIGVVPNCDPYLEIWQPGFRTYNLIVPNLLNLPFSLAGIGAPKDVVGLGLYVSSRAAGCAYCSAHTCSFALRRGSSEAAVTGEARSPVQAAAAKVAETLSTVPHTYRAEFDEELERHLSADEAEWVVMGVAMMGFLNKFMDAMGVELEPEAIDDVADLIEPTGWSVGQHDWAYEPGELRPDPTAPRPEVDSFSTALPVLRSLPGALRLDRRWQSVVSKDAGRARRQVAERSGFDEPLIESLRHARVRRALAAVLHHNLDPDQSVIGLVDKALAGLVFANRVGSEHLADRARAVAAHHGADPMLVELADRYTASGVEGLEPRTAAALRLAHAFGPSPAEVDQATIDEASAALSAPEIVELAVWASVNQLLHRLTVRRLART